MYKKIIKSRYDENMDCLFLTFSYEPVATEKKDVLIGNYILKYSLTGELIYAAILDYSKRTVDGLKRLVPEVDWDNFKLGKE